MSLGALKLLEISVSFPQRKPSVIFQAYFQFESQRKYILIFVLELKVLDKLLSVTQLTELMFLTV